MTGRSSLQPGPETGHYHDTLGVARTSLEGIAQQVSRVGPVTVMFDDAGFVDPDDNGPVVFTIPAGALFLVMPLVPVLFDQPGDLTISLSAAGELNSVGDGNLNPQATYTSLDGVTVGPAAAFNDTLNHVVQVPQWTLALVDTDVAIAFYPDGDAPTAGQVDVYALIAVSAA